MTQATKTALITAWNWCDIQDKSTEFMFVYMSDISGLDYEKVVEFVIEHNRTEKELLL